MKANWLEHRLVNQLQAALLILALLGISALAGGLLFGAVGVWLAIGAGLFSIFLQPRSTSRLTLGLYRARPLSRAEAPRLWAMLDELARRAGLAQVPVPHWVPSAMSNAFAVGDARQSAIAVTDGLLRNLSPRELAGVLAHETAHIAQDDLRVMGLADYVSRLTGLLSLLGQLSLLLALPWLLDGSAGINWSGLLLLIVAPHLAILAQLGLSRTREFDADLLAARLTGDPEGLAAALLRIDARARGWQAWLMPGWGNPEPSWLRTHPSTAERVRRLLELAGEGPPGWLPSRDLLPGEGFSHRQRPRWYPGGYWR